MELKINNDVPGTDIAIIGMAGRFPGAPDVDAFWQNLCNGVESVRFFNRGTTEVFGRGSQPGRGPTVREGIVFP